MSTPLNDLVTAERRLASLRLLVDSTGYTASADLLQMVLHKMGLGVSLDRLATDLQWLQEQGLIEIEICRDVMLAKLAARGMDVAQGLASVPGVARPRPE